MTHCRIVLRSRFDVKTTACIVGLAVMLTTGCHTAASLGLPLSAGSHYVLSDAVETCEAVGIRPDVATELAKVPLPPHRVEAGDVLVIEPNDFNSSVQLPSDHTVQQEGTIDLGVYGRIQVAGLTVPEIQQQVEDSVLRQQSLRQQSEIGLASHSVKVPGRAEERSDFGVLVRLVSQEQGVVYVMGEVNAPGAYPIVGSETVLDAIITAGGLSDRANDRKIMLTRPRAEGQPRVILPVRYQQIVQLGETTTNYQLQPGDRIYVPSLTLWEDIKQSVQWKRE